MKDFDFIIVGGRCAGASLAFFLGKYGYNVLLIDRYSKPGPIISTHIIGETDVYERLGIKNKMENAGAPLINRMRIDFEGNIFESDIAVTPRVIGLRRELLDSYLLEAANEQKSVTIKLETKVVDIISKDNKVIGVTCMDRKGNQHRYYAQTIIGADGRDSVIASKVNAEVIESTEDNHHGVYFVYVTNLDPLSLPAVEWYWHKDRIVICNPIDRSMHCIALMIPQNETKLFNKDIPKNFHDSLHDIKTFSQRAKNIEFFKKPRGISRLKSHIKQSYGEGWALVGDAAVHLHPVSGTGIDNAVCTAEYLATELNHYMQKSKSWSEAMVDYVKIRDERVYPQYYTSINTLSRTREELSEENKSTLSMLCTFPSFVKSIGTKANEVINLLSEESNE
ncbi:NAD(P)/FAD-dependent oxidoreductase [Cytobacillus pseudoceanisediminis]|uniref:NAD(P)/FAD-dependent oxidoreductase n=1 Tax=Cytobacillus pseudoceanisediminis TaxID=3051614 RepID=UPI003C2C4868